MKTLFLGILTLVITACASLETLPPQQTDVTQIKVFSQASQSQPVEVIADPDKINQIIAFINDRSAGWKTPFSDKIDGEFTLYFYRDERFVGNFYVGDDYFGRDYGTPWLRNAEPKELTTFINLLDVEADLDAILDTRCSQRTLAAVNRLVTTAKLVANVIKESTFNELKASYPNWCTTTIGNIDYKVYESTVAKNRIIVERMKAQETLGYYGPFNQ